MIAQRCHRNEYRLYPAICDDDVDVGEVGLDEDGLEAGELLEAAVQEYHVHDVVADVPLTLDLKR